MNIFGILIGFFILFYIIISLILLFSRKKEKKRKNDIVNTFHIIRIFAREKRIQKGDTFKWKEFWNGIKNIVYQHKVDDFANIQLPNKNRVYWKIWLPLFIRRPIIFILSYLENCNISPIIHFLKKILEIPVNIDISKMRNQNEILIAVFQMALNIGQIEGYFNNLLIMGDIDLIDLIVENYDYLDYRSNKEILERVKLYLHLSMLKQ